MRRVGVDQGGFTWCLGLCGGVIVSETAQVQLRKWTSVSPCLRASLDSSRTTVDLSGRRGSVDDSMADGAESLREGSQSGRAAKLEPRLSAVGRCRLTVSKPVLKALMVSALEATI